MAAGNTVVVDGSPRWVGVELNSFPKIDSLGMGELVDQEFNNENDPTDGGRYQPIKGNR